MTLTPLDIENVKFRSAFGGYNRSEVDTLLARVSQELETRLTQIEDLQRRIGLLEQSLATYRESEELLKNSVVLAQRTSDEIIAAAHQQADAIRREAEHAGRDTARRLGELKAEREQFEYAFHGLLAGFLKRLEQGNPALSAGPQPAELAARSAPAAESAPADPLSHSRQLLSEAGIPADAPPEFDETPRIPDIPVPPVPQIPTPGDAQHAPAGDDFERAIEDARPAPREQWPPAAPTEPVADAEPQAEAEQPAAGDEVTGIAENDTEAGADPPDFGDDEDDEDFYKHGAGHLPLEDI